MKSVGWAVDGSDIAGKRAVDETRRGDLQSLPVQFRADECLRAKADAGGDRLCRRCPVVWIGSRPYSEIDALTVKGNEILVA